MAIPLAEHNSISGGGEHWEPATLVDAVTGQWAPVLVES